MRNPHSQQIQCIQMMTIMIILLYDEKINEKPSLSLTGVEHADKATRLLLDFHSIFTWYLFDVVSLPLSWLHAFESARDLVLLNLQPTIISIFSLTSFKTVSLGCPGRVLFHLQKFHISPQSYRKISRNFWKWWKILCPRPIANTNSFSQL